MPSPASTHIRLLAHIFGSSSRCCRLSGCWLAQHDQRTAEQQHAISERTQARPRISAVQVSFQQPKQTLCVCSLSSLDTAGAPVLFSLTFRKLNQYRYAHLSQAHGRSGMEPRGSIIILSALTNSQPKSTNKTITLNS